MAKTGYKYLVQKESIDDIRNEMKMYVRLDEFSHMRKDKQYAKREYKYLVPKELLDDIRNEIKPFVYLDKYAQRRKEKQYTVRSIYYDTTRFWYYDEKVEGWKVKKKIRIRGYNLREEDNLVFLEIKRKYEHFVHKNRAPLRWDQMQTLFSGNGLDARVIPFKRDSKEEESARRFLYNYYRKGLLATVLIIYEREAFHSKFDRSLRITFDKNIRSSLYPSLNSLYINSSLKFAIPRYFILEVKFYRGLPLWVRSLITRYELQRLALSKYTICIDSHQVARKFARSLRHISFIEFCNPKKCRGV